ncbi:hypothetical protein H9X54_001325, partial [Flavobacterium macrobrachii]
FTDTNNCGVKVFFPCMSKFKKNQIYLQGFVYLSCATRTAVLQKRGVSCFYDSEVLNSSFVLLMKFSAENPRLRKAAKR